MCSFLILTHETAQFIQYLADFFSQNAKSGILEFRYLWSCYKYVALLYCIVMKVLSSLSSQRNKDSCFWMHFVNIRTIILRSRPLQQWYVALRVIA
jgi:hypothetical protein